jgi:hypothetical protein
VYLPAIEGYVPKEMLCAMRAFLEFCYIARHDVITETTLADLEDALARFHRYRTIFLDTDIRETGFSLPRQHSANHYPAMIRLFGAPNGLCSSITKAKHIKAVKEPWRRSNHNKPLKQMLFTNQRLDKLAAARVDFTQRGMLEHSKLDSSLEMIGSSPMFCCASLVILIVVTERTRKAFDVELEETGKSSSDKDLFEIVNDPNVLACTELGKVVCT